ncbi:MAG: DNA translocase FtsK [Trueperaceae bacterium]
MKKSRKPRTSGSASRLDLEAVGLVLLALGIFASGILLPALPTGDLGATVRNAQLDRFGWAAYALPLPLLVLGALFLMRRNPRWWPRALLGYLLLVAGLWGLTVALAPAATGAWGQSVRQSLGATWGTLAAVPAVVLATVGVDLLLGWAPTRLLRGVLRSVFGAVRRTWKWLSETRRKVRKRAAFQADVAQARKGLTDVDRDLQALSSLYPGSAELERWRGDVQQSKRLLADPTDVSLKDARADVRAWQSAVAGFTKDRAVELGYQLGAEGVSPPDPEASTFEVWATGLKRGLDDPLTEKGQAADALERVRKALALDLVALIERQRRLARERDQDQRELKRMTPRQLAGAYQAHQNRVTELHEMEGDADALAGHALEFERWRPLLSRLTAGVAAYPQYEELADYHQTLAAELGSKGRDMLLQDQGWDEALTAVLQRAEVHRQELERAAAEQERLERQAAAEAAAAAQAAAEAELTEEHGAETAPARPDWVDGFTGGERDYGAEFGAVETELDRAGLVGKEQRVEPPARPHGHGGAGDGHSERVERALLDDQQADQSGRAGAGGGAAAPAGAGARDQGVTPGVRPDIPAVGGLEIQLPPLDILDAPKQQAYDRREAEAERQNRIRQIDETLSNFRLNGRVVAAVRGPTVTRFEVEPAPGEKISRFANLADDLALAMAVGSVRIEAPIPGKSVIGLEVPNAYPEVVRFREAIESSEFRRSQARMPVVLGRSIEGEMWIGDLTRMPHLLIAGSTGSGKSVAVNTLISSLLYHFLPTQLRFLMIDPKMVELTPYDGIQHLLRPVVTNPADAAGVLLGAVSHMERRYKMMSKIGAKNLDQYNEKAAELDLPPLPFITIIIDELADLMITSPKEVESAIMRLAQMARATGMHLILATQRPSVDILTSLIKVNVPARMAFAVSSSHDSRTILDSMGAERLTGRGDMLFYQPGLPKAVRLQGPFVSERETTRLADFLRRQFFDDDFVEAYGADFDPPSPDESEASGLVDWNDDKLRIAAELVINEGQASVSRLQRRLSVGHARAGKLMDSLEGLGVVGPHQGSKPREVLVPFEELPNIFGK